MSPSGWRSAAFSEFSDGNEIFPELRMTIVGILFDILVHFMGTAGNFRAGFAAGQRFGEHPPARRGPPPPLPRCSCCGHSLCGMQLERLNEVVMEKPVSAAALRWQRPLTTPPLVVLLLYLQNAQLSFKPALCLPKPGRAEAAGGVNSCVLGAPPCVL